MTIRREEAARGVQRGSHNHQENYFAPITQRLFVGAFERLRDVCFDPAPLARELDLARFTGRQWLIGQIDTFIKERPRGYVIVQAEAGMGKSTLAAHLAASRSWPCHFTRLPGGRSPEAARKSLAAQLIARWDLQEWAPDGMLPVSSSRPEWFSRLLEAAAHKCSEQATVGQGHEPIVIVVDGLDEAEPDAVGVKGGGLPLGLPQSLPDAVYVVATSRFGIDRALHAVRNPANWLQIEVEGTDNLDDMHQYVQDVTSPAGGDPRLLAMLRGQGVDIGWFRANVARVCGGVWIYLRYVLDEIRDGARNPHSVGDLPSDLAAFYAEQVDRWRGAAEDETAQRRWEQVRLPLLGVLGAARAPLSVAQIAAFAGVTSPETCRVFIEETVRAFLSRRDGENSEPPCYSLRHHSLRDLLAGNVPARPDLESTAHMLAAQVRAAHRQIVSALTPDGEPSKRNWGAAGPYARQHLAAHAAACGELDALVGDPGFLLAVDPAVVLAQRAKLRTPDSGRALAAFELSLHDWDVATPAACLDRLAANAARVHAVALSAACTDVESEWPVLWAAWTGRAHRRLPGHDAEVTAVAIGRAGDRDIIVSGSRDGTVRIWDAVTGDPVSALRAKYDAEVTGVAIGRAGDRDIIVSGSRDGTVRIWDAVTCDPAGVPLIRHFLVTGVAIGRAGDRDVIVAGSIGGAVRVWDAVTCDPVGSPLVGHDHWVTAVAIGSPRDRDIVVCGSTDGAVRVWDAVTGDLVRTLLIGHDAEVSAVAVGRAGDRDVIVAGSSRRAQVWDAVTGEPVDSPSPEHDVGMAAVAIGRAGDRDIIVAGSFRRMQLWDAVTGDLIGNPPADHDHWVGAVAIGQAGDRDIIVSSAGDAIVSVWDAVIGTPADSPTVGHADEVSAVAIGQAGGRDVIVSGSRDGTALVWDAVTGAPIGSPLVGHDDWVTAVAIGRAGDRDIIVSSAADGTVRRWDALNGAPVGSPLVGQDRWMNAVAIGRAGDRDIIVAGSGVGTLQVWDAVTGTPIAAPSGHQESVLAVAIGRAGGRDIIVSGSNDTTVGIWDAVTGRPVAALLAAQEVWTKAVAIGRTAGLDIIVAGYALGTVRVWNAITGSPIAVVHGHEEPVTAVAIGRIGDRDVIVSGAKDNTVRVWDAVTGTAIAAPLAAHDGCVEAVAVGRAGDRDVIVSGSADRTVLVREHRPNRVGAE